MLYKRELINSVETIGYNCCIMMGIVMGPSGRFTHVVIIGLFGTSSYRCCTWVELPVQRRLYPILWSGVG